MENTARGVGVSGKYSTRHSRVLYLPRDPTPSAVFSVHHNSTGFNSFIVFVWEDYQCYFVVIDSQCDAFSKVSIIGDALYLTHISISNAMLCDNLPFKRVGMVVQRVGSEAF